MQWTGSAMQAVNIQNIKTFTAGEAIATKTVVYIKAKTSDTATILGDTFISELNPDTNSGGLNYIDLRRYTDQQGGQHTHGLMKFYSIPNYYPLEVKLYYYVHSVTGEGNHAKLYFISQSWIEKGEGGVTYNTKPTLFSGLATGDYKSINLQSGGTGWQEVDITKYIRELWEEGEQSNFRGVYFHCDSSTYGDFTNIEARELGHEAYITYTIARNDNKIYATNDNDYWKLKNIVGITMESIGEGSSGMVQVSGIVDGLSFDSSDVGTPLYACDSGGLSNFSRYSNIQRDWSSYQVGLALSTTELLLDIKQPTPFLIESFSASASFGTPKTYYIIPWARKAVYVFDQQNERGELEIERYGRNHIYRENDRGHIIEIDWSEDPGSSKITITGGGGVGVSGTLYIYE